MNTASLPISSTGRYTFIEIALTRGHRRGATTHFWTLIADADADDVRVDAGRHAEACGVLLNRAFEITSLGAASGTTRTAS